jgi:hypothetical protein
MNLHIQCLCIDTTDPQRLADFWRAALGWRQTHASAEEVVLEPPLGSPQDGVSPDLLFGWVPEVTAVVLAPSSRTDRAAAAPR